MDPPIVPLPSQRSLKFPLVIGILTLIIIAIGGYYFTTKQSVITPKVCTMEARICPDGTTVGRSGPNCEFAPCPTQKAVSPNIATNLQCGSDNDCQWFDFGLPVPLNGPRCVSVTYGHSQCAGDKNCHEYSSEETRVMLQTGTKCFCNSYNKCSDTRNNP